uniref:C2H2-type domain-containing protein n=1 Tax=Wuchereria bancrofti TaxID=6293 RepID=A0A1I8ER32_WUCBA
MIISKNMGERFPFRNFEEFTNSSKIKISSKSESEESGNHLSHPNHLFLESDISPKKRILTDSSCDSDISFTENEDYASLKRKKIATSNKSTDTIEMYRHVTTVDTLTTNRYLLPLARRFYGSEEGSISVSEPELTCSICNSKVLKKFLELHAWMHLSWMTEVGDRHPFQCTRCNFTAFRIPDVVCHTNEIHDMRRYILFIVDGNVYIYNGHMRCITARHSTI